MKFTINSHDLATALANVSKVQASKNAMPILDCVLFDIKGSRMMLLASDSEVSVSTFVDVTDAEDGTIAIESKQLLSAIKEISDQPITVTVNGSNAVNIAYNNGCYDFVGNSGVEFPLPREINDTNAVEISSTMLIHGINATQGAIANDELRPQMNGIYLDDTPRGCAMVASDGRSLVKYTTISDGKTGIEAFIIPAKTVKVLKGLLRDGQTLILTQDSNQFCIKGINGYELTALKINIPYPNYNSVIPSGYTKETVFNRLDLLGALRRVGIFASQTTNQIVLHIGKTSMTISAQDIDYSTSAVEKVGTDTNNDEEFTVALHLRYLTDRLGCIKTDMVRMQYNENNTAVLLLPMTDDTTTELIQLLMPMQLL